MTSSITVTSHSKRERDNETCAMNIKRRLGRRPNITVVLVNRCLAAAVRFVTTAGIAERVGSKQVSIDGQRIRKVRLRSKIK